MPRAVPSAGLPVAASGSPVPNVDEQLGETFTQDFASLSYNVTAVPQADVYGYGPAYLLNGLTDIGYWYQIGLSWDWPYVNGGYGAGFNADFEVFNSSGSSVFPVNGTGGLNSLSGTVNTGDTVLLNLYFASSSVKMLVKDFNTGAFFATSYVAQGSRFVGTTQGPANGKGFFTGLMTEWYHVSPYYGSENAVTYSDPSFRLSSAWMWADEYLTNETKLYFEDNQLFTYTNPNEVQSFSYEGAVLHSNAYQLTTGASTSPPVTVNSMTLSYSVAGGGSGYSPPVLNYYSSGIQRRANLSTSPTQYVLDAGSQWSVGQSLLGSSSAERWVTQQQTTGTASNETLAFAYTHQYNVLFGYSILANSAGSSAPTVTYQQFGTNNTVTGGNQVWADAGSPYDYASQLPGSTVAERWEAVTHSGTLSSNGASVAYYQQYDIQPSVATDDGSSGYAVPAMSYTSFGARQNVSIGKNVWADAGTTLGFQRLLPGGSPSERWVLSSSNHAAGPQPFVVLYQHQYLVQARVYNGTGGNVTLGREGTRLEISVWMNDSRQVTLGSSSDPGWKLASWVGSGKGAYSGASDSALIAVDSPVIETATFEPGLVISAGTGGEVTYHYNASVSGTVAPGSQVELFLPVGSRVALSTRSGFPERFVSWSANLQGQGGTASLTLSSPLTVTATFALDYQTLAILGVAIAVVIAAAALVLTRRSHRRGAIHADVNLSPQTHDG